MITMSTLSPECTENGSDNHEVSFFSQEEIALLDKTRVPHHVAIIPDGNRRWAKKKHSPTEEGHREGIDTIMEVVKAGKELGVKIITFYLLSTENWNRSKQEIAALMWLLQTYLINQQKTMIQNGIRLQTIGDLSRFPPHLLQTIEETKCATSSCNKIEMVFALNYGGRDDIRRGFQALLEDYSKNLFNATDVNELLISRYLDTAQWKDPDLLIRTSGELRISNFLLWQISYSEIYVTNVLWPDFTPKHFLEALMNFQKRDRRLGGT